MRWPEGERFKSIWDTPGGKDIMLARQATW
jgi:hypothetical protein